MIDTAKARELLLRLVEIPGVTGDESEACAYFARALSAYGWNGARVDACGNVIATRGSGRRDIVLMGHIDTVAGGPDFRLETPSISPNSPHYPDSPEGEILWGRGSVDARGPLCAFAVGGGAAEVADGWRLVLIAAVGEEGDSRGARHVIPLYKPEACVIGEPSGTSGITIGYRGYLRIRLLARDGGAHRSGDAGPATACLMAASNILREVARRDDISKLVIERPFGAVISMEGKESAGRSGMIDLDVRLPVNADPDVWAAELLAIANGHFPQSPIDDDIDMKRLFSARCVLSMPAHVSGKNDKMVLALRSAVRKGGFAPRLLVKGGTADFNLAAAWKCPMAAYGPGDSKFDHTDEERISISEYTAAASILKDALERFMRNNTQQAEDAI